MSNPCMRISLSEKSGEIKGTISSQGDGLFCLEALSMIVETFARSAGVPVKEYLDDLKQIQSRQSIPLHS